MGIRAYTVAPGAAQTLMFRAILGQDRSDPADAPDPADVARVIANCVTGDASCASGAVLWVERNT